MDARREVLVLGIGNLLWADEGFGVRAVEALNQAFRFPDGVELMDGGTLGLSLLPYVETSRRVLVSTRSTSGWRRAAQGPARCRGAGLGRAQDESAPNGFNDVLALAQLHGAAPEQIVAIGVQPLTLG